MHHSFDMILFDFLRSLLVQPFLMAVRREMQSLHEYQADERVLRQGVDTKQYQLLLIRKSAGEFSLPWQIISVSATCKKESDDEEKQNNRQMRWNYAMVLPVLFLAMTALSAPKLNAKVAEVPEDATLPVDSGKVHPRIVGTSLKDNPLVIVDGQKATTETYNELKSNEIESVSVLKNEYAIELYGGEGHDGWLSLKQKSTMYMLLHRRSN